jgi:small-conductance mechanosensitive channel
MWNKKILLNISPKAKKSFNWAFSRNEIHQYLKLNSLFHLKTLFAWFFTYFLYERQVFFPPAVYRVLFIIVARFYYCCSFILFIVCLFIHSFVRLLFSFDSLLFIYPLFVVQRKKIQFWSWIVFQVFRSCCTIVQELPSSSMQVNKHHTSDCTDFVLV